jgi:hypothetical protein
MAAEPLAHAGQVTDIAGILHQAFESEGLRCTLVGGSAIEVHAPGIYKSGDIDVVIEGPQRDLRKRINVVFLALGFSPQGKHWNRENLFVEVPDHFMADPTETLTAGKSVFEVVTKEVVLAYRIVGFMHWKTTAYAQQAIDMIVAFGDELDLGWLRSRLEMEASWNAFLRLRQLATSGEPVTEDTLQFILAELHRR